MEKLDGLLNTHSKAILRNGGLMLNGCAIASKRKFGVQY